MNILRLKMKRFFLNMGIGLFLLVTNSCKTNQDRKFYIILKEASTVSTIHSQFLIEYNNPTDTIFIIPIESLYMTDGEDTLYFGNDLSRPLIIYPTLGKIEDVIQEYFPKVSGNDIKRIVEKGDLYIGINNKKLYSLSESISLEKFKQKSFTLLQNKRIYKHQYFSFYNYKNLRENVSWEEYAKKIRF
jgi:hypothetical protein